MIYRKKIRCCKENLKSLREFVKEVLLAHQLTEEECNLLVLAVDEVCSNIIIHSNSCNPKESLELKILAKSGEIVFEVQDKGESFNITEYPVPPIEQIIKSKKIGGIGLILVKKIMDQVYIEKKGKCNIYKLHKYMANSGNLHSPS